MMTKESEDEIFITKFVQHLNEMRTNVKETKSEIEEILKNARKDTKDASG